MQLNDITHESNSNSTNLSQIKKISLLFIVKMDYHYNKMCNNNNCTETLMKYANFNFFKCSDAHVVQEWPRTEKDKKCD